MNKLMGIVSLIMVGILAVVVARCPISTNMPISLQEFKFNYCEQMDVSRDIEKIRAIIPNGNITLIGTEDNQFKVEGEVYIKAKNEKEAQEIFKDYGAINSHLAYIQFEAKKALNESGQHQTKSDLTITLPQEMVLELEINKGNVKANHM
ncbi:hypothetical protein ACQKII_10005 [Lysinibacillus sp. NPDC048646]|uniref:hypothetical protein n=1 Tax=Lysinibacillus sp. NPDC048646 TaxID=3390574 RepID=UPI003CFD350C